MNEPSVTITEVNDGIGSNENKINISPGSESNKRSKQCLFCSLQFLDPEEFELHLEKDHYRDCFQCGICFPSTRLYIFYTDLLSHYLEQHGILKPEEEYQLYIPRRLEQVTCSFCSPSRYFLGKELDDLMLEVYDHVFTQHESEYAINEDNLNIGLTYFCRICVNKPFSRSDLEHHLEIRKPRSITYETHLYPEIDKSLSKPRVRSSFKEKSEELYSGGKEKSRDSSIRITAREERNSSLGRFSSYLNCRNRSRDNNNSSEKENSRTDNRRSVSKFSYNRASRSRSHIKDLNREGVQRSLLVELDRNNSEDTRSKHHKKQKTSLTGKLEDRPKFRLDEKKKNKPLTDEKTKYDLKTPRSFFVGSENKRTSQSDRSNERSSSSKERTMKSDERKNFSSKRSNKKNAKSVWSNEGNYSSNKSSSSNGTERGINKSERMNWSHEKKMKIEDQRSNRWNFKCMSIEDELDQQSAVSEISEKVTDFLERHRIGDKKVPSTTSSPEYECKGERGEGLMKKVECREKTSFQTISRSSKPRLNETTRNQETRSKSVSSADTKTKNDLFSCLLCYEKFINAQYGIDHLMSAHGVNINPEQYLENFDSLRTRVSLFCKLCEWRMDSNLEKVRLEGRYHIQEHQTYSGSIRDGFRLMCMVCQFQIDELSPAAMSSHLGKHGNQAKNREKVCGYCLEGLDPAQGTAHYTENHILDLFSCLLCQDVFHLNISAVLHLQDTHNQPVSSSYKYISKPEGNKSYLCLICGQRFFNRSEDDLRNHFRQEHDKELNVNQVRFSCRLCARDNVFYDESSITDHENTCGLESYSQTEPVEMNSLAYSLMEPKGKGSPVYSLTEPGEKIPSPFSVTEPGEKGSPVYSLAEPGEKGSPVYSLAEPGEKGSPVYSPTDPGERSSRPYSLTEFREKTPRLTEPGKKSLILKLMWGCGRCGVQNPIQRRICGSCGNIRIYFNKKENILDKNLINKPMFTQ